jgi:outer membrane protein assembly factor BamD
MFRKILLLAVLPFVLTACGLFGNKDDNISQYSQDKLFKEAKEALNGGDFNRAIKLLENFESRFPYGVQAQQAILDTAWANYRISEFPIAVSNAERFIKQYPTHEAVDYAYYLKGLALFGDELTLFSFIADQDISERDQKARREAYFTFRELSEKFPNSKYAPDARLRMRNLINSLAEYEVHIARYYYNRGAFIAALSRAQQSITQYPQTASNEEALHIMVKSHQAMGKMDLAADVQRVLAKTYPTSQYVAASSKPWWKLW